MKLLNPGPGPSPSPRVDDAWIRDLWRTAVQSRWLIVAILMVTFGIAVVITVRQPRVYESAATILFQSGDAGRLSLVSQLDPRAQAGDEVETAMAVLRSRRVVEEVVDSLDLHVRLLRPAASREEVFAAVEASTGARPAVYHFVPREGGSFQIEEERGDGERLPVDSARVGQRIDLSGVAVAIRPAAAGRPIHLVVGEFRSAVDALRGSLQVTRLDARSQIVNVRYRTTDPELAAQIPNAVARTYIDYRQRTSKSETSSTVEFLRSQVAAYDDELRRAESQLQSFREAGKIVSLTAEAEEQVARLVELQAQRDQISAEIDALDKLLRAAAADATTSTVADYRQLASFPAFFSNRAVQDILSSLTELENERAALLVRRTPANLDVRGLDVRIDELEDQLYQVARSYAASQQNQLASINASLAEFGVELEKIPAREIEFARLARQQTILEELYTLLQSRLKEAEIQNAVESGDVRILDPALVPRAPVSPQPLFNLVIALVLGISLSATFVFGRYLLDTKVRTEEDALAAVSIPLLAVVPRLTGGATALPTNRRRMIDRIPALLPSTERNERRNRPPALVTLKSPRSAASEAYRTLRTSLTFASQERGIQVVMVTSAIPGEGKSVTSANLAVTFAQQGLRTLLVDGDLRRGDLHTLFDLPQAPGLSEVLLEEAAWQGAMHEVPVGDVGTPLRVLTAGSYPATPAELISSARLRGLLQDAREEYEMVVLDVPPLNLVGDATVIGQVADVAILVSRVGYTERADLEHAAARLNQVHAPIGGLVLNDVPFGRYTAFSEYYTETPEIATTANGARRG